MDLNTQLTQLETAQLVRRAEDAESAFQFKHTLTQETVYGSLLRARRRLVHAQVARAYEDSYADRLDEFAALLAQHYDEAGDDAKTLEYATRAGNAAARIYANMEALEYYTRAIDTLKRSPHLDIASSLERARPIVGLYLKRGRVLELLGRIDDALANYQEMQSLARERGDRALELAALSALATIYSTPTIAHDPPKAKRLSDDALELARAIGDRASEAKILWNLQNLASFSNVPSVGITFGEQALAVAQQFNLREQMAYILNDISRSYLSAGESDKAMRAIQDAKTIWDELGNVPMQADNLASAGETSAYTGALTEALEYTQRAIDLGKTINNSWVQAYARWTQGLVLFERGDVALAITSMKESRDLAEQAGFAAAQLAGQSDLSLMYSSLGAFDRAIELCQQVVENSSRFLPFLPWTLAILSRIHTRKGDLAKAAQFAHEAHDKLPVAEYIVYLTVPIALADGDLRIAQQSYPDAISAVEPIIARFNETGIGYRVVEAFLVQGRGWLAQRELDRAEEILLRARGIAERMLSRQTLWQIMREQSRIAQARGDPARALALREQARGEIDFIAAHTPPDLRVSFLALPDVRETMEVK
jgi:tetratricopeptide (TPR) repeat protein